MENIKETKGTQPKQTRYLGPAHFETQHKDLFFGRDKHKQRLYDLVLREDITLLYAKSGLGKSSLIHAGLVPLLTEKTNIVPLFFRLGAYNPNKPKPPLVSVAENLPAHEAPAWLVELTTDKNALWFRLKSLCLANPQNTYLLVFDQFEELFTYPELAIQEFKRQMAEFIYQDAPKEVWQASSKKDLTDEQWVILETKVPVKVLFSIREDKYSLLNTLTDYLPTLTRNYYALEPLGKEQAKEAIVNPALAQGDFASVSFDYTHEALQKILRFLTKEGTQPIESTQLQILCNRIEGLGLTHIDEGDIPNFEDVFLGFYYDSLAQVPEKQRLVAQRFIENELIRKEQRISLDKLICLEVLHEDTLHVLANTYLLRPVENTTNGISYEIAHDTLIKPILIAKNKREIENRIAERKYSTSYMMAWIVTAIFFLIGFYHVGVGLSEAKFLGGVYGSFLLALGLLIFMSLAYQTAVQTGSRVALVLYLLCAFVSYICNFNSLYPNYMGYALTEKELKEKLKTYQQFAETPMKVIKLRDNGLLENYQRERATLEAELSTGDGGHTGASLARIERLLSDGATPIVINRLTFYEPRDQWKKNYLDNADKAFDSKMKALVPCYDGLVGLDSKISVSLRYVSKIDQGFQKEVDDELRKSQNEVKIKERLELIEKMVQTYKQHCTAINNSNCRDNPEYQKAKCDESIRVKNKDLGRFDHTFPSAYENIGEAGTLAILFICFMIDFLVPIGLFFLLRGYEIQKEELLKAFRSVTLEH